MDTPTKFGGYFLVVISTYTHPEAFLAWSMLGRPSLRSHRAAPQFIIRLVPSMCSSGSIPGRLPDCPVRVGWLPARIQGGTHLTSLYCS